MVSPPHRGRATTGCHDRIRDAIVAAEMGRATRSHRLGFPVFRAISVCGPVVVITPVGPMDPIACGTAYSNRVPLPIDGSLPHPSCRVGTRIGRFEACSTIDRVTTCLLGASPRRYICRERSDGLVTSTAAPRATG
jgi:hypothetical protein